MHGRRRRGGRTHRFGEYVGLRGVRTEHGVERERLPPSSRVDLFVIVVEHAHRLLRTFDGGAHEEDALLRRLPWKWRPHAQEDAQRVLEVGAGASAADDRC